MDNSGMYGYQDSEHYLRRVLTGNVNDVRRRLTIALERLDYDFIDEESDFEIRAKRNSRGWASAWASADVLDYPRTLVIKFKPLSENLTRASFAYVIKHPSLQRGEKEVLTREAETLSALATVRATDKICAVCGTESNDESRFCRNCGAPMTSDETAIEILRMTAETRSGHTSIAISTIIGLFIALMNIAAIIALLYSGVGNKGVFVFLGVGIFLSLLIVVSNGFGWKRLNNALKTNNKNDSSEKILTEKAAPRVSGGNTNALPSAPAYSVIEDTTSLLDFNRKTAELVERQEKEEK